EPIPAGIANGRGGASGGVPADKAERPVSGSKPGRRLSIDEGGFEAGRTQRGRAAIRLARVSGSEAPRCRQGGGGGSSSLRKTSTTGPGRRVAEPLRARRGNGRKCENSAAARHATSTACARLDRRPSNSAKARRLSPRAHPK